MDLIRAVDELFHDHGHHIHPGQHGVAMTAQAHALQCAQRAEWADAEPPMVIAALLHDIGHFIPAPPGTFSQGDDHDLRAVWWLAGKLPACTIEAIRLHVQAKRYLAARDPAYPTRLPAVSQQSLLMQGGPMARDECGLFETLPYARQALALRRWDDQSHEAGMRTPTLRYYLDRMETVIAQGSRPARLAVAALEG